MFSPVEKVRQKATQGQKRAKNYSTIIEENEKERPARFLNSTLAVPLKEPLICLGQQK